MKLNCATVSVLLRATSVCKLKSADKGMLADPARAKDLNTKRHLKLIQKSNIGLLIMAILDLDFFLRYSGKGKTCGRLLSIRSPSLQPTNTKSYFFVLLLVRLFVDNRSEVRDKNEFFANLALRTSGVSSIFMTGLRRLLCCDFASNLIRSLR